MNEQFDHIVIGTGQAGPSLAAGLAANDKKIVVIERGRFGGTCVNRGCIPTKALVECAHRVHDVVTSQAFGIEVLNFEVDFSAVMERVRAFAEQSSEGVRGWMEGTPNVTVVQGHARFISPDTVEADGRVFAAREEIFINVGARPGIPPIEGLTDVTYLTNADMLRLEELPRQLVVIGASYIGLEFAQAFRRLGSEVTVIEMAPRVIPREDEDVSRVIQGALEADGIQFFLSSKCIAVKPREDGGVDVTYECGEDSAAVSGTHLLVAAGRQPNTDDLCLDGAGISTDERGFIEVDDLLRVQGNPKVYAVGDCNGRGAFTHTAVDDSERVLDLLLRGIERPVGSRDICYCLFVDPPLGRVGLSETQARQAGLNVKVLTTPMNRVTRAKLKSPRGLDGKARGFIKHVVDTDTETLVGSAIVGPNADEVIGMPTLAVQVGVPMSVLSRLMLPHPTVGELASWTFRQA